MVLKPLAALALLVAGATPACAFISPLSNGGYIACSPLAVLSLSALSCLLHQSGAAPEQHARPSLSCHGPGFTRNPLIPALFRSAVPQSAAATRGTAAASASPKLRKAQVPSVCALKASSKASSVCVRRIVCAHTHAHAHTHTQNGERRDNRKARTHTHIHTHTYAHTHTHTHTHTRTHTHTQTETHLEQR
jgi:hypothetical protein